MMVDTLTQDYRSALGRGELIVQKCDDCSKLNMYPRYACPHCQSESLGWQQVSGRGVLHSFTVSRIGVPTGFEEELPYALAVVKLEEGVQLLGRLVADSDGEWKSYSCDDPVELVPEAATEPDARPIAWFRRAA